VSVRGSNGGALAVAHMTCLFFVLFGKSCNYNKHIKHMRGQNCLVDANVCFN
jgi:hypothetical protein